MSDVGFSAIAVWNTHFQCCDHNYQAFLSLLCPRRPSSLVEKDIS